MSVLGFAVLGIASPCSEAARQPTPSEGRAIRSTVEGFVAGWYYATYSPVRVKVSGIRVSTADRDWAMATIAAPAGYGRPALDDVLLLWHAPGSPELLGPSGRGTGRAWVVVSGRVSMEYSWCGIPPAAVARDLNGNLGC